MLDPLFKAIAWLLSGFYSVAPDLGVSIILLTIVIMLLLYPLTAKASRSMISMQRIAPEVKKLQAKFKGDRQKLNEETMKLYQANKINPLGGCLPLVLQAPIFISLFSVLRNTWKYVPTSSGLYHDLCGGADVLRKACEKAGPTDLGFISVDFLDLSKSATDRHGDVLSALPYWALVVAVIVLGYLQTRQAQKRAPSVNRQMGMVLRFLPVVFGIISVSFPSGVVLYWFVSSLWRLGQQEVIFRHYGSATTTGSREHKLRHRVSPSAPIEVPGAERTGAEDTPTRPGGGTGAAWSDRSRPARGATGPGASPARAERGLRGLLQLPPPTPGNDGGARPGTTGSPSPPSSAAPKPAQARRRNRKKRKR